MMFGQRVSVVLLAVFAIAGSVGCATMGPGCGCGVAASCGCDVGCAVEPACGLEPGCGCEPSCGCGAGCCGASMAGQRWCGDGCCGPRKPLINVCTGPDCCGGCDPGCGCEPGCAVEPGCGCEPSCGVAGCGSTCGLGCGCGGYPVGETLVFGVRSICSEFRCLFSRLGLCCPCGSGCGGCDGEPYWSEWHNDPPVCCDPCDQCGNWVGPTSTSMRAPYDHEFSPRRVARLPDANPKLR